jgi:glycosyltransferase involved in cell wall biosynthesis
MKEDFEYLNVAERPVRILHVVGCMNRGGLETWLMQVLRIINRQRFQIDILTLNQAPGVYDSEVLSLGSQILYCPYQPNPLAYIAAFKGMLKKNEPYDAIHSHVHFFSGFILRLAKESHIPCRIAHSHIDLEVVERQSSWLRKKYFSLMRYWIQRFSTHGLATSSSAALNLFGPSWPKDMRVQLLLSGVDLKPFEQIEDSSSVRELWGIPPEAFVIGHIGRFESQKNHRFLIEVIVELIRQQPHIVLMLVGEGPLRSDVEQYVETLNLTQHVIFTGSRPDVPEILLGAFDAFIFPSNFEGLGMALVEAQVAGLPCIISDVVPKEADVFPDLVMRLSLEQSSVHWSNMILKHVQTISKQPLKTTLPVVKNSSLNIRNSISILTDIYTDAKK